MSERLQWELDALTKKCESNEIAYESKIEKVRSEAKAEVDKARKEFKEDLDREKKEIERRLDLLDDRLSGIDETTKNIEKIITESSGMAKALRWAGGAIAFTITAVLSWMKLTGKG